MTIAEILKGTDDKKLTAVPTPEWPELDGQLFARKVSAAQKIGFWDASRKNKASSGAAFVAMMVTMGATDKDGIRAFGDDDFLWLQEKDGEAIGRLAEAIDSLNVLSSYQQGNLEKNSESPENSEST